MIPIKMIHKCIFKNCKTYVLIQHTPKNHKVSLPHYLINTAQIQNKKTKSSKNKFKTNIHQISPPPYKEMKRQKKKKKIKIKINQSSNIIKDLESRYIPISAPRPYNLKTRTFEAKSCLIVSQPYTMSCRLWRSSSISYEFVLPKPMIGISSPCSCSCSTTMPPLL